MRRHDRVRLAELQTRLTRLRETASWLSGHAALGREMGLMLVESGSPTWRPTEDLSWRTWIEREGDEQARHVLVALYELLEERAARIAASEESAEGS